MSPKAITRILSASLMTCVAISAAHADAPATQPAQGKNAESAVKGELGTKTNPVRCDGVAAERAYLNRLRGPDGKAPEYARLGSFGGGPYGNILDGYRVVSGGKEYTIFLDMYHPNYVEKNAVPGFTIVEPEARKADD